MGIMDSIRNGIKTFLRIVPAQGGSIAIQETLDESGNAIKNRIWYRGDCKELGQMYRQLEGFDTTFWGSKSTSGMEIRKIHTGLPKIIINTLTSIVVNDLNPIEVNTDSEAWEEIEKENKIKNLIEKAVRESLIVGDGAFKISFDNTLSEYPILEFYPGDKVDFKYNRGRIKEVIFHTEYRENNESYVLDEIYGIGYINYVLKKNGNEVELSELDETKQLLNVTWSDKFMMAVPLIIFESSKYCGRGESIIDSKTAAFDALDESISQWMDALRANRTREYIPETMLPRNPETGEVLKPNSFDNRYIKVDSRIAEGENNKIEVTQGEIMHDSYLATYVTALDICLQGLVSPSTLGIDGNKIKEDTATAQIEREKATLYTRNTIIAALTEALELLVVNAMKSYKTYNKQEVKDIEANVSFGEYNSPAFDAVVETVGKAKTYGIMSIERCVREMYGDSLDEDEIQEEIERLKNEQGIATMEEISVGDVLNGDPTDIDINKEGAVDGEVQ